MKIKSLSYYVLYLLPKNFLTVLVGYLTEIKRPKWLVKQAITIFARHFKIDFSEAEKPLASYTTIQEVFVRTLKPAARNIDYDNKAFISPCDGTISQIGKIESSTLIQAKKINYSLYDLLKSKDVADLFKDGDYCTIYLAPHNYHRFHAPFTGNIYYSRYYPGFLWPVNSLSVNNVDGLFCQNERVLSLMNLKEHQKKIGLVFVAATMVGKIKLNYSNISINRSNMAREEKNNFDVLKADEIGTFMFGSTIILLFEKGTIKNFIKKSHEKVKMGEKIAEL